MVGFVALKSVDTDEKLSKENYSARMKNIARTLTPSQEINNG
jgi:hypothetical protein